MVYGDTGTLDSRSVKLTRGLGGLDMPSLVYN